MTSSKNKYDTLEQIIFEQGLRILGVHAYQELNLLLFVLNNGKVLRRKIDTLARLRDANQTVLDNYHLIAGGVGVHWPDVDEDLSLKGLLKAEFSMQAMAV
ncbi:DUF2442 domain-containing protein [Neolewinella litorea]|uniref:DUF2442 domain-containing protein n=1 Tax=Neolewinella litorea TaxID=2562452 RepID=UPI00145619FA|nr:DUF2442 domain-containing protein [Neolewinella litorea]